MSKISLEQKKPYLTDSTTIKYVNKENGFTKIVGSTMSKITIEPIICFYVFALVVSALTTQNLNLDKACNVNLQINKSVCDAIKSRNTSGYDINQEVEVQKLVASIYTWKFIIQSTFSVIILAFVGSWSDRNGRRKACIIVPMLGELLTLLSLMLCTYFFYELPMEFNIASELLSIALTGGMNTFLVGAFTMICSKTTVEERTIRVGIIHVMFQMAVTVALGASGVLLFYLGLYGVYGISLTLHLLAILYGTFIIYEEKPIQRATTKGFFRDFFDLKSLKSNFDLVFKNKDKLKQKKIFLILLIAMMVVGPAQGEMGVVYLYTRYKFHWNEVDFGIFFSVSSVVHLFAGTFGLFIFSKVLKMDDSLIGCIAAVGKIVGALAFAFAPTGTVFYMAIGADILTSILFITMRSIVTKQAGKDELGKMNAIFGLAEALVHVIYGPLYSATNKWTINIFPGTFYVLSGILTLPVIAVYVWLYRHRDLETIEEPEELENMKKLLVK